MRYSSSIMVWQTHIMTDHTDHAINSTTSFLTATTLIYICGAGITAAAGTRLALHLILDNVFRFISFQLPELNNPSIVISYRYLTDLALGNLRACCLPWMW